MENGKIEKCTGNVAVDIGEHYLVQRVNLSWRKFQRLLLTY